VDQRCRGQDSRRGAAIGRDEQDEQGERRGDHHIRQFEMHSREDAGAEQHRRGVARQQRLRQTQEQLVGQDPQREFEETAQQPETCGAVEVRAVVRDQPEAGQSGGPQRETRRAAHPDHQQGEEREQQIGCELGSDRPGGAIPGGVRLQAGRLKKQDVEDETVGARTRSERFADLLPEMQIEKSDLGEFQQQETAEDHQVQRVDPREAGLDERAKSRPRDPIAKGVGIGVRQNEAAEHEEEVDPQITLRHEAGDGGQVEVGQEAAAEVVDDHRQRGDPPHGGEGCNLRAVGLSHRAAGPVIGRFSRPAREGTGRLRESRSPAGCPGSGRCAGVGSGPFHSHQRPIPTAGTRTLFPPHSRGAPQPCRRS